MEQESNRTETPVANMSAGSFSLFDSFLVAAAAQRFVFFFLAQQHSFVAGNDTVRDIGQVTASYTDGVYLGYLIGYGTEGRHGAERYSLEVHVQSGYDDPYAPVGQFVTDIHQTFVEELCLVDAYHVNFRTEKQDAGRRVDGVDWMEFLSCEMTSSFE